MKKSIEALESLHLPTADVAATSSLAFSDGGQYRIEIPSTETPENFQLLLDDGGTEQRLPLRDARVRLTGKPPSARAMAGRSTCRSGRRP